MLTDALLHILSPRLCGVCGCTLTHQESIMCMGCLIDLPRLPLTNLTFNDIHHRIGTGVHIHQAAAWYSYSADSPYADLIRHAKYHDRPRQARLIGRMMASEMAPSGIFDGIDLLVPVPMPWYKRLMRTFNQSEQIALGIADVTGIPVEPWALRARRHRTQSRLGRQQRRANALSAVTCPRPHRIAGRHILVVDDIITTGATISATLQATATAAPASISVLAAALTHQK